MSLVLNTVKKISIIGTYWSTSSPYEVPYLLLVKASYSDQRSCNIAFKSCKNAGPFLLYRAIKDLYYAFGMKYYMAGVDRQ